MRSTRSPPCVFFSVLVPSWRTSHSITPLSNETTCASACSRQRICRKGSFRSGNRGVLWGETSVLRQGRTPRDEASVRVPRGRFSKTDGSLPYGNTLQRARVPSVRHAPMLDSGKDEKVKRCVNRSFCLGMKYIDNSQKRRNRDPNAAINLILLLIAKLERYTRPAC